MRSTGGVSRLVACQGTAMTTTDTTTRLQTDPVAQELLRSTIPARLAYVWRDGKPRVVPMWFHWTGEEFLMGAPPNAPKMKVLADHPDVALRLTAMNGHIRCCP